MSLKWTKALLEFSAVSQSYTKGFDSTESVFPFSSLYCQRTIQTRTSAFIGVVLVINGEIRFPLFRGLGMVVFMDGGNVWRELVKRGDPLTPTIC